MQTATETAQALLHGAEPQAVYVVEDPTSPFVFGEAGGPREGGLVPPSHTLSRVGIKQKIGGWGSDSNREIGCKKHVF